MSSTSNSSSSNSSSNAKRPTVILVIGMAGSGKTTAMQRFSSHLQAAQKKIYVVNLDPAVATLPYSPNVDIRDTVKYKEVMKVYNLGPNGAILTALNLFTTKFEQLLSIIDKRAAELDYILIDTPGQIEVFTWSASGSIITDTLAASYPTVVAYVIDTPRTTVPATFMSNMLYACSILYKTRLPFVATFNKTDVVGCEFAMDWMSDFEKFQEALQNSRNEEGEPTYMDSLVQSMSLVLDEFYTVLRRVGMSAVTGAGVEDFFTAVQQARVEYDAEYRPELERMMRQKVEREEERRRTQVEKLMRDVSLDAAANKPRADDDDEDDGEDQEAESARHGDEEHRRAQEDKSFEPINAQIAKEKQAANDQIKLLLLGAGESGKSTIFKQIQLIYGSGYTDADRQAFRSLINSNILTGMLYLLRGVESFKTPVVGDDGQVVKRAPLLVDDDIHEGDRQLLMAANGWSPSDQLPAELVQATLAVWNSRIGQAIRARAGEFNIPDSLSYYMSEWNRIMQPTYLPTDQDILRVRVKTTAIVEKHYQIGDFLYKIIDVGGQRSERRKWIHCFENVTSIIFVAAISEYDQVLTEDPTNRLEESLQLFGSISNSQWFIKVPIILFLNKVDLFRQKMPVSPPHRHLASFPSDCNDPTEGQRFFKRMFQNVNKSSTKSIYTHYTCATDTKQMEFVLVAVQDIVRKNALSEIGILTLRRRGGDPEATAKTTAIDKQLRDDAKRAAKEVKLLLLGAGESGKSTVFKQMQLVYGKGYTDDDRRGYKAVVMSNVANGMKKIIEAVERSAQQPPPPSGDLVPPTESPGSGSTDLPTTPTTPLNALPTITFPVPQDVDPADRDVILQYNGIVHADTLPADLKAAALNIWKTEAAKTVNAHANEFQLLSSTAYFMSNLDRISEPGYLPSDQDIVYTRIITTAIVEKTYQVEEMRYTILDVGGQRSERRKWINCFQNVTAIIFVAAISEYDQTLYEDERVNRVQESRELFGSICNSPWFVKTPLILFLNKVDLFREKVPVSSPKRFFPSFPDPLPDIACAERFFQRLYEGMNKREEKQVYTHFTCATDTKQITFVLTAVKDIIMKDWLTNAGLL
ncbi:hypothetical protein RI367_003490 [Sorochytrium milnesiophthora]